MNVFHDVEDEKVWTNAWNAGANSRHEMFGKIGVKARTFKDPNNANATGLILEIPDMAVFDKFMQSDETKRAMEEDGLKIESIRMLTEFRP